MVAPPTISDLKFHIADFHFLESGPTQTKARGSAVWLQDGQSGWILTHPPSPGGAKTSRFPYNPAAKLANVPGCSNRSSNETAGRLDNEAYVVQCVELDKRPRTKLWTCFSSLT